MLKVRRVFGLGECGIGMGKNKVLKNFIGEVFGDFYILFSLIDGEIDLERGEFCYINFVVELI